MKEYIEFKHKNTSIKNIGKDVLKLIQEKQNGAIIHLLNNTDSGTLCKAKKSGVFNKLYKSFSHFKENWNNDKKHIHIIVLSLKQELLIYRKITKDDLDNLKKIFLIDEGCGNMTEIKGNEWKVEYKTNNNE